MIKHFKDIKIDELTAVASFLVQLTEQQNVVIFKGHMGAGKTTFIKIFCKLLRVVNEVTSPTFSLVNEYQSAEGLNIYHFDFYRLEKIEEAYDMGYEEYFYSSNICLIEWPDKIEELLPENVIIFQIEGIGETRNIKIEY